MPELTSPDPATDPTAAPQGAAASSARIVPLRRTGDGPVPDDVALAATDDDAELEATLRPRRRWLLSMPANRTAWAPPVTGALSVIFGVVGLFKLPLFLAPLAILLALIAGWRGHHAWAVIGLGTGLVALLTSFWFWAWLGMAWLYQSWG